ncbi:flagellar biosynthetic protein FliQ [Oxalobacteraceae bacterium GrIS 2.11]
MTPEQVMDMARHAMEITLMISIPMLMVALVIGLIISIFQAATQINEMTLSFIPKLVGVFLMIDLTGPWMLGILTNYFHELFMNIPRMVS